MHASGRLFIGSDHAGFELKSAIVDLLNQEFSGWEVEDCGPSSASPVDYPDFAKRVAEKVAGTAALGVLICGSGIGMAIAANKIPGVRAAQVWDVTSSRLSRRHNGANIVCFGARLTGKEVALDIVRTFLKTEFEGGRHAVRLELIGKMEKK